MRDARRPSSPRVGFAYDLTGDNRTVLKGYFGQSRWNSADTLADLENPVGARAAALRVRLVHRDAHHDCDLNGNRLLDGPQELGPLVHDRRAAAASSASIATSSGRRATSCRSTSSARSSQALSGRVSYVYKNMRNVWGEIDAIRAPAYTVPFTINDPGPDSLAEHR